MKPSIQPQSKNLLVESGLPLIFQVKNSPALTVPKNKTGTAIRTLVRSLTLFQKEALVVSSSSGQTWRLASDEGKYLMGHEAAPAPLAFFTVGLVAAFMNEILALAQQRNIQIQNIRLILDNYYSMQGSMPKGTMQAYADNVHLEAQINSPANPAALQKLVVDAVVASPLNGLLRSQKSNQFSLVHNGVELKPNKVQPCTVVVSQNPKAIFAKAQMQTGDWSQHLVRGGRSPKMPTTDKEVSGSSLASHQNRQLHLRGICTLREDGVKVVEQQLFNPLGDIFYFLSDEGVQAGGQGLAPDAFSYLSAGIGFCFMTQFGRFAKMQNSTLKEYHILQDSQFSLGGAITGLAGEADPLKTHCSLFSNETDAQAQYMLGMAEQTCFLHSFCRTDLKCKVKMSNYLP